MDREWAILRKKTRELHRGPMNEIEARDWLKETEDELGLRGLFTVAWRPVSPWVAVPRCACREDYGPDIDGTYPAVAMCPRASECVKPV